MAVDLLLGLGVAAQWICCIGLVVMRNAFDRLHYAGAASTVGPLLILAAVLAQRGLDSAGLQAIATVGFLFLLNPVLVTATARAARRVQRRALQTRR